MAKKEEDVTSKVMSWLSGGSIDKEISKEEEEFLKKNRRALVENPVARWFLGSDVSKDIEEKSQTEEIQEAKALQTGDDSISEKRAPLEMDAPWAPPEEKEPAAPSREEGEKEPTPTDTITSFQDWFKRTIDQPEAPKRSGELELVDAEGKPVVKKYGDLVQANKQLNNWIYEQVGAIDKKEQAEINNSVARLDNKFAAYKQKIASLTGQADRESKNLAMGMLLEGIVDGLGMIAVAATTKGRAEYSKGKGVNWDMLNAQIDKRMKNQMAVLDAQFNFDQSVVKDEMLQAKYNAKAERDRVAMMAGGAQRQISTQEKDVADKEAALQKYKEMWFGVQKEDQIRKETAAKENRAFELQEKEQRLKYDDKEQERKAKKQRQQLAIDARSIEGTKDRALKERMQRTAQEFEFVQNELNRLNKIDVTSMGIESRRELQEERMKFEAEQNKLNRELQEGMLAVKLENSVVLKKLATKQQELDRISRETIAGKQIDAKLLQGVRTADLRIQLQESDQTFKARQKELDRLLARDKSAKSIESRERLQERDQEFRAVQKELDRLLSREKSTRSIESNERIAQLRNRQQELDRQMTKDLVEAKLEGSITIQKLRDKQKEYDRLVSKGNTEKSNATRKEIAELKIKADKEKAKLRMEFTSGRDDKAANLRREIKQLEIDAKKEIMREEKYLSNMYGAVASPSVQLSSKKFEHKKRQDAEKKQGERYGLGALLLEIGSNESTSDKPLQLAEGRQLNKFPNALNSLPAGVRSAAAKAIGLLKSKEGTKWYESASDRDKARETINQIGEALSSGKSIITTKDIRDIANKEKKDRKAVKKVYEDAGYVIISI